MTVNLQESCFNVGEISHKAFIPWKSENAITHPGKFFSFLREMAEIWAHETRGLAFLHHVVLCCCGLTCK